VVAALGEGEDPLRRPPGLDPAAQGPGRVAGLVPVVGELGGGGGLAGGAELGGPLQRHRVAGVDGLPLPRQQVELERLAQQRVPEAEAAAVGDQQQAVDGLPQQLHHLGLGQPADRGQQRRVEPAAGGRRHPQQPPGRWVQGLDPDQEQVAERLGQGAAAQAVGGDQLLDEVGVALGPVHDGGHGLRRGPGAGGGGQVLGHLGGGERGQLDLPGPPVAAQLGQQGSQRVLAVQVVGPVGRDHT
jgi:hypothetical protein